MEWVNIKRLKGTLRQGELPAKEVAKYLAAQGALLSILMIPSPADAPVGWAFLAYPLLGIAGVYFCYRQNGGAVGRRFAERYLAVGWVVGLRFAFVLIALMLAGMVASLVWLGNIDWIEKPDPGLAEGVTAIWLVIVAFIYWRIGRHLREVHESTTADSPQV